VSYTHVTYIVFLFALGACIGSFLNVVVWRLPRGESLSSPPSHCPKCDKPLPWYDNIPIFGWIKLGGKCRYCRQPISIRYPIVELVTALLFVFYYVMYYMAEVGPCSPIPHLLYPDAPGSIVYHPLEAPIFLLHLFMVACLLAASLIDLDLWLIPRSITYLMAAVGVVAHAIFDSPNESGALNLVRPDGTPSPAAALAAGGAIGLGLSLLLWWKGILKQSFPQGEPLLDVEREAVEEENEKLKREGKEPQPVPPPYEFRLLVTEMRKEMAFLLPPMALAILWWFLTAKVPAIGSAWDSVIRHKWVSGLLGSLFGAMVGGGIVWVTRILGTLGFRRVAMGLGDVDLMFGIGAVIGAGAATVTFFIAPFFGLVLALYMLLFGKRRELPYGPYLGMAAAAVLLCYCPIEAWLEPGLRGLALFFANGGSLGGE
jgi:leader peptidase (prepilin peptidase) / N-methyltransferase